MSIVDGLSERYRDLNKLGEGAMGEVWRGVDRMLEREVAIKLLRPELKARPEFLERFRNEAISMARINHPNIVGVYEFAQVGDLSWIAMEFVPGGTLEALLAKCGRFGWVDACDLVQQALLGLERAHAAGILHRDIKPANVMVTPERVVKIGDFGIARISQGAKLTRVGHAMVTLEYAAPERLKGVETDARADLYSMGIILYELLVGALPFSGNTDYEIMHSHAEAPIPVLDHVALGAPREMQDILTKALCKDPQGRFASAAEFRRALEQLRVGVPGETRRQEVREAAPAPVARQAQLKTRLPVGVLATLGVAVALGLGIALWPKPAVNSGESHPSAEVVPVPATSPGPATGSSVSRPDVSAPPVPALDPESEREKLLAAAQKECADLVAQARNAAAAGDYATAQRLAKKSLEVYFNCEGSQQILAESQRIAAARAPKPIDRRPAPPADRTGERRQAPAVAPPVAVTPVPEPPAAPPAQVSRPPPVVSATGGPPSNSSNCASALAEAENCLKDSQYTCAISLAKTALQGGDCPAARSVWDRALQARNSARRNQPEIQ